MFEQLNELKYTASNGKTYILYFLKFWQTKDKKKDYIVKYQIRSSDKDFVWYARMSKERALSDLKLTPKIRESISKKELGSEIEKHLKEIFVYVIKKGLDKDFNEPNTEFVFYKKSPVIKRIWNEST